MDISSEGNFYGTKEERTKSSRAKSNDAFKKAKARGAIPTRKQQATRAYAEVGDATGREAYEYARLFHNIPSSTNCFGSRLAELCDDGVLVAVGMRPCRYTGDMATVWRLAEGPVVPRKKRKRLSLFAYFSDMERKNLVRCSMTEEPLRKGEVECVLMGEKDRRNSRIAQTA